VTFSRHILDMFDRFNVSICNAVFPLDILLEGNADFATRLATKAISRKEYFSFTTADGYGKVST
jgi:hypothetical protein